MKNRKQKLRISVIYDNHINYFYYPDISCKTTDGGMRMLLDNLKKEKRYYVLIIDYLEGSE